MNEAELKMIEHDENTDMQWLKALGLTLWSERVRLKFTQEELSKRSNVNRTYLSDIETGKRKIKVMTLNQLAQGLNTSSGVLLEKANERFRTMPDETTSAPPAVQTDRSVSNEETMLLPTR